MLGPLKEEFFSFGTSLTILLEHDVYALLQCQLVNRTK